MLWTFIPPKPSKTAKSISLQNCSVFPANAMFIFMWSRVTMLKWSVEEAKDVNLSHDGFSGHNWTPSDHACWALRRQNGRCFQQARCLPLPMQELWSSSPSDTRQETILSSVGSKTVVFTLERVSKDVWLETGTDNFREELLDEHATDQRCV